MATETNLEREYKFDVDVRFEAPDLRGVVKRSERRPEQILVSSYFDTADHRLWAHGMTLRHRSEAISGAEGRGKVSGAEGRGKWTLKLPDPMASAGADDRGAQVRTELSWPGACSEVPDAVAGVVAGVVRHRPLVPLAVLEAVRSRVLLHTADGSGPWAEIDDDTVIVTAGRREGLRFRQVELELIGPPREPATLARVLERLDRAGAVPGGASKVGLAAGLEPPTGPGPEADPASMVAALAGGAAPSVVAARLGAGLDRLVAAEVRLRVRIAAGEAGPLDGATLREAESALHRLRRDVDTFAELLDARWGDDICPNLDHLARLLGRLGDEDVLVGTIRAHAADPDAQAQLSALVRAERHQGCSELAAYLSSPAYIEALERLGEAAERPPLVAAAAGGRRAAAAIAAGASRRWQEVLDALDALGDPVAPGGPGGPGALYRLTVLVGRLGNAAEAAEPVAGRPARRTARAARRLEAALEELDRAVYISWELRRLASHAAVPAAVAYEAGRIAGRAELEAEISRDRSRKAAAKLRKRSPGQGPPP